MKFNLTITDIETTEIDKVINALNIINAPKTETAIEVTKAPVVEEAAEVAEIPEGDFEQPAPFEPAYDKNGLPWDARIHSSNHKLTDKGIWQRRRGVTDIEFEKVKNELLGLAPQPVAPVAPQVVAPAPLTPQVVTPAPVAPVAPVAPTPMYTNPAVMNQPVFAPTVQPTVPAQPVAPVAPTAPAAPDAPDANILFQTMFDKIKAGMAAGVVGQNYVQTLMATINAQFGTQYQAIAAVRDNVDVMQYIINDLVTKGL